MVVGGDLTEIGPARHQVVGLGRSRPVTISQPTTRRSLSGRAHWAASDSRAQPSGAEPARNMRATDVAGSAGEHAGRDEVGSIGVDQVLDVGGAVPGSRSSCRRR